MSERYIPEHRRTQFKAKNTFKPEELRRRREEQQVEIRKQKREENLAKRRGIGTGADRPGASLGAAPDSDDENPPTESQVCLFSLVPAPPSLAFACPPPVSPSSQRCRSANLPPLPTPLLVLIDPGHILHPQATGRANRTMAVMMSSDGFALGVVHHFRFFFFDLVLTLAPATVE